jgi:hypothetical protein
MPGRNKVRADSDQIIHLHCRPASVVEGSVANVIGLPLETLAARLAWLLPT